MHLPWDEIDTVLLDMDGTLLDRYFDDYFWEVFVPREYAESNGISTERAAKELTARYKKEEGTLNWTDLDFWSEELGLDIPFLKTQVEHLIQVHPYVERFLCFLRDAGKEICLVTNAHGKTLDLKMKKTLLGPFFHEIISAHDFGVPKEDTMFWKALVSHLGFDKDRALLAEDSEANLRSARQAGIRHLVFVARPSTQAPIRGSSEFPSIIYFLELLPGQGVSR
ncbi:MAG: haloacid dehalogenase [Nitrospirae bacterium CG_4_9_14_3_um_filter_53_35]|nr:MAG: haloacid dehalogenase [Nitrospirae bacterium CG2_30_53_67]PIS37941.1 MAG: haloacid dehalogenase [Nitrospirae bacterium CG08_land_8_20_14_0_20_52_24]PIV83355.1 MAG: haloacid dehalogenase [Nitrospirae bacterium CG17_big_fil_post_rev_8_21_14_2_50_50_9]PIW84204.1 MAG: haloacid dehalogenase [Nitrospirae bacterium CG_4_8_14_3_um_filter_50_41]PIX85218.1 MAG: haloacid dehalogenase [Nitrospirae bacterium CG_4_10_14_3_um_filter_53_41]PJA72887.1 MAG: haloacid dehalogenase [Nitrospirae bacterium C